MSKSEDLERKARFFCPYAGKKARPENLPSTATALDRIYPFMLLSAHNLFNSARWRCSNLVHKEARDAAL
jgi:hypothetical protein